MPRYSYECVICENTNYYMHGFDERPEECITCHATGSLVRNYSKNAFMLPKTNQTTNKQQAVGTLTKEYIEENKKILDKQKAELKEKEYEQT